MKYKPANLSAPERANFRTLAEGLLSLPEIDSRFSMGSYHETYGDPYENRVGVAHPCLTSACAIGYAPQFGIPPGVADRCWVSYCENHFCETGSPEFAWCFDGFWQDYENSPHQAAQRILTMLDKGIPDGIEQEWSDHHEDFGDMLVAVGYIEEEEK